MSNEIHIFAVGLTQTEQRLLMGICTISQRRVNKLTFVKDLERADVFLVDKATDIYKVYQEKIEMLSEDKPLVLNKLLVTVDGRDDDAVNISRPIEWSRLPNDLAELLDKHKRSKIADLAKASESNEPKQNSQPQKTSKHSHKPAHDDEVVIETHETQGSRILVVDDSLVVREQLKKVLTKYGYEVTTAESGEEALAVFKPRYYDRVLLDVIMPNADGYEVCRKIKHIDKHTPVIMLTSKSSPFDKIKGKMAGCKAYLTKPVVLENLLAKLS